MLGIGVYALCLAFPIPALGAGRGLRASVWHKGAGQEVLLPGFHLCPSCGAQPPGNGFAEDAAELAFGKG